MHRQRIVSYSDTKKSRPVQEHQSGSVEKGLPTNFSTSILRKKQEACQG